MPTKKIHIDSTQHALTLFGHEDSNLRTLEERFKVNVFVKKDRGSGEISLILKGPKKRIDRALDYLNDVGQQTPLPQYSTPYAPPINHDHVRQEQQLTLSPFTIYVTYNGKLIEPRTENQKRYIEALKTNDIVVAIGPAGTGKTFLAVAYALKCLKNKEVSRIVLTRPVVEAGEKLGFLPGDLYEKVYPYLKPLYDSFYALLGPEKFKSLQVTETIEIVPLAYMRGRTLEDAFIILDEAQNATMDQMKMFLTRMGSGSKIVITGDITQIDLENKKISALPISESIIGNVSGIAFVKLNETDVVRHAIVKKIIRAYEDWEDKNPQD